MTNATFSQLVDGAFRALAWRRCREAGVEGGVELRPGHHRRRGMRDRRLAQLLAALADGAPEVRLEAVWQLCYRRLSRGRLSRKQRDGALCVLARHLREDPHAPVRAAAAHAFLWHFGSVDPTGLLVVSAEEDPDPQVRGHALEALAVRWSGASRRSSRFEMVETTVAAGLDSESGVVRFWAVYAAGLLELTDHRRMVERLAKDPSVGHGQLTVGEEALAVLDGWGGVA